MATLVTQAEYARLRGCSREAVRKAIASERISGIPHNGRVMIDPGVADIQWARNTDADQQQRGAPIQFERTHELAEQAVQGVSAETSAVRMPKVAADLAPPPSGGASRETDDDDHSPRLVREKTETERLRQQLMSLDIAQKTGELVRKADVELAYTAKVAAASEALDAIPDRISAQLAVTTDPVAIHALLSHEIASAKARFNSEAPAGVN